jgi:hypothetical protein
MHNQLAKQASGEDGGGDELDIYNDDNDERT